MSDPDTGSRAADDFDINILAPDVNVQVGGRTLTVHELTLRQSLQVHARMAPVMRALAPHYAEGGDGVGVETVLAALAAEPDLACELLALCTGQEESWIAGLPERDGTHLMLTFIAVHIPFFVTRLELWSQQRIMVKASMSLVPGTTGPGSGPPSPGSSVTGTAGLN